MIVNKNIEFNDIFVLICSHPDKLKYQVYYIGTYVYYLILET